MSLAILAVQLLVSAGGGDLIHVPVDVRLMQDSPWMQEAEVVHREADGFLALSTGSPEDAGDWTLVESGPVDLDRYRILYRAQIRGEMPDLPGEVALETEKYLLIRLPVPDEGPVEIPGIGFLRPLRRHAEPLPVPTPGESRADTALVDEIVAAVSEDSLIAWVDHLESYGTRYMTSPEYDASADWADTWIESHGVPCELQPFYYSGDSMSNVVAEMEGSENPDDIYIICGHLDSYSNNPAVAPGADDNGSGSAAVLEAARVMSPYTFRNTVRFVLFGAEEAWMVGSEYYVEQAYQQGDNILGAINMDMILYAPNAQDSAYIPYDDQSEWMATQAGEMFGEYAPSIYPRVTYDPAAPSDHASFWQYGYTAIEVVEGSAEEIWGGYNPYYHQASDTLGNYLSSFPYGTDMVRASIGLLATLAEPVGPSSTEGGSVGPVGGLSLYPNPSVSSASLDLNLGRPADVSVTVYDLSGRAVRRLHSGQLAAGRHVLAWDGADASGAPVPSGLYVFRVSSGGDVRTASLCVLR